jgi:hypothetical protein
MYLLVSITAIKNKKQGREVFNFLSNPRPLIVWLSAVGIVWVYDRGDEQRLLLISSMRRALSSITTFPAIEVTCIDTVIG